MFDDLTIGELNRFNMQSVRAAITSMEFSLTLDSVSEITFTVWDNNYAFINGNYFMVRREVAYFGMAYEIASVEITAGEGSIPIVKIQARNRAIQRMKRDKNPAAYGGGSATDFARSVAAAYGLGFSGQATSTEAAQAQTASDGKADSVWDVLKRGASEAQFAVFESDNKLYFASEEWLLGKWANVPFNWPSGPNDPFTLYTIPNCRTSEDDVKAATIKFIVDRTNGTQMRPGMTVNFNGINNFTGPYLVSEVSFTSEPMDPVSVSVRTPVKPKPKNPTGKDGKTKKEKVDPNATVVLPELT
jgi:hypothetical protein